MFNVPAIAAPYGSSAAAGADYDDHARELSNASIATEAFAGYDGYTRREPSANTPTTLA
jgi:hypothetical protein